MGPRQGAEEMKGEAPRPALSHAEYVALRNSEMKTLVDRAEKQRRKQNARPFLDEALMDGSPPNCKVIDFVRPRLRKCPFDLDSISWRKAKVLGTGMDGIVWRVHFGKQGPFALKVFWDNSVDKAFDYYAIQRECHNAALLQMMQASVEQACREGGDHPPVVLKTPVSRDHARFNSAGFSDEERMGRIVYEEENVVRVRTMPRFAKCYGWLRFNIEVEVPKMPFSVRPYPYIDHKIRRSLYTDDDASIEYYGIVYEYIEDGENDPETVEAVDRFLHLAGFVHGASPLDKNWKSSVLVDHADIIAPAQQGWTQRRFKPHGAADILNK